MGCIPWLLAMGVQGALLPAVAVAESGGEPADTIPRDPASAGRSTPGTALPDMPRQAVVINPVGSALSSVLSGIRFELDSLFSVAMRYERTVSSHWGWVAAPHYAWAEILSVQFRSLGVKVGPRYSPGGQGLRGAYVLPQLLVGNGWVHQSNRRLVTQFQMGLGLEGGYVWGWGPWQVEAGAGVNYSGYLHHDAFDGSPSRRAGWAPLLNTSVGYAW